MDIKSSKTKRNCKGNICTVFVNKILFVVDSIPLHIYV